MYKRQIPGLFGVGEVACVSVHGANRLGGNSLLDLVVFGRAAGKHIEKMLFDGLEQRSASQSDVELSLQRLNRLNDSSGGEDLVSLRTELQSVMQNYFGVFRKGEFMRDGIKKLSDLGERIKNIHLRDKSNTFNTARIEALELELSLIHI